MKLIMAWLFHIPLLVRDTDSQPRACTIRPFYYSYSPNKNDSKTRIFPREEFDKYVSFFFTRMIKTRIFVLKHRDEQETF